MSRLSTVTVTLGSLALAAFVACADSAVEPSAAPPADQGEGGTLPPPSDASTPAELDAADAEVEPDAAPPECSREGFCHTVVPKNQTLRGVWSDGAGVTWAVSEQGAVLRYDGAAWAVHATLDGALRSVWGSSATDIWVGGDSGLFHGVGTSSSNITFTAVPTPGPATPIFSIWGTGADDVWATGNIYSFPILSRVLHYAPVPSKDPDAGTAPEWSLETVTKAEVMWTRVFGSKASGVWVGGEWFTMNGREPIIVRRAAGSDEWLEEPLPRKPSDPTDSGRFKQLFDAKASTDGQSMWMVGLMEGNAPAYAYATSTDGGNTFVWTWGSAGAFKDPYLNAIGATGTDGIYIAGDYARLRVWNGVKWKQAVITVTKFPIIAPFYAIGGQADDLWFVGEGVALHRVPSKIQQ